MDKASKNSQSQQAIKQKLAQHIQNRQRIRQLYEDKGIQMLGRQEQLLRDTQDPQLHPTQSLIYDAMVNELKDYGFIDFKFLGAGSQGLVLVAKQQQTQIRYAIKGNKVRDAKGNIHQESKNQTLKEIEQLEKCQGSPYVVNLLSHIEGKEFIYLIFNECQGTLTEIIRRSPNQKLNEITAIKYAKDIAEGLLHIHSKKIVLNDLKMDNILIDYNGNAIVSDLGLADDILYSSGPALNQHMGNALFKAPECYQLNEYAFYQEEYSRRNLQVDTKPTAKSESFAFGYLMYVMLSGFNFNLLYNKHQPLQYDNQIQQFTYFKQLKYVIDGLTQFIPSDRFTIKEVLIILKGIICIEFKLDESFMEVMQGQETIEYIANFRNDVEFVQQIDEKFYPIIQDEQSFLQEIQINQDESNETYEQIINELQQNIQLLESKVQQQEKTILELHSKEKVDSQGPESSPVQKPEKDKENPQKQQYLLSNIPKQNNIPILSKCQKEVRI